MTKSSKTDLTAARVRELFDYDPITGILRWRVKPGKSIAAGTIAGTLDCNGYVAVSIDYRLYKAHVLAWLHYYGVWPPDEIDHEDRVRNHNWIDNLRIAGQILNNANRLAYRNNASGFKGVHRHQGRWRAMIRKDGKSRHIGSFDTREDAHAAYCAKARELFGEFANAG